MGNWSSSQNEKSDSLPVNMATPITIMMPPAPICRSRPTRRMAFNDAQGLVARRGQRALKVAYRLKDFTVPGRRGPIAISHACIRCRILDPEASLQHLASPTMAVFADNQMQRSA